MYLVYAWEFCISDMKDNFASTGIGNALNKWMSELFSMQCKGWIMVVFNFTSRSVIYYEKNVWAVISHLFHKYQQKDQSALILTKLTEQEKTMTYDVGNPCPD